jgi:hypothetical protein
MIVPQGNRPVVIQPSDGDIRIGGQQGRPPDLDDLASADQRGIPARESVMKLARLKMRSRFTEAELSIRWMQPQCGNAWRRTR